MEALETIRALDMIGFLLPLINETLSEARLMSLLSNLMKLISANCGNYKSGYFDLINP